MNSNNSRRLHGPITTKSSETDQDGDHVPFGVVNSMKQRFLNKVNESYVFHHHQSTLTRTSLSKPSSRQPSNENLLQTKSLTSPLKRTTRLSRSQDNLSHQVNHPTVVNEQFMSYLQPKQDLIIVDTTSSTTNDHEEIDGLDHHQIDETKIRSAGKTATKHRQSYNELHCDEVPKPGTVTTVKNMFERQIRLSRYDADKLLTNTTPAGSRMSSQHRDFPSPSRSRSMSPNDLAVRQRRTNLSTGLSLPVPSSYPDLVISHTPPTESTKTAINNETMLINTNPIETTTTTTTTTFICKEKKIAAPLRPSLVHESSQPLTVIVDDPPISQQQQTRPNLLLPSTLVHPIETVDCQLLDFKSRLALFNRTNGQTTTTTTMPTTMPTKSFSVSLSNSRSTVIEEKKETTTTTTTTIEPLNNQLLTMGITRSVVNTAKAVTFYGGNKLNSNQKSSLPSTIPPPPPPSGPSSSINTTTNVKSDVFRAPDVVGGNVKLNKSSISSGSKKDARVQFIEDVDTFEYPSFDLTMAEFGGNSSDDEQNGRFHPNDDDEDDEETSPNEDEQNQLKILVQEKFAEFTKSLEDVDDDELERLARINAKFNSNENSLKPKGTLHTFRPTHLDQYELGNHNDKTSDKTSVSSSSSPMNTYSILARQKLLQTSDNSVKNFTHHPVVKTTGTKLNSDLTNNIQWSSMSTTTDLLF